MINLDKVQLSDQSFTDFGSDSFGDRVDSSVKTGEFSVNKPSAAQALPAIFLGLGLTFLTGISLYFILKK